MKLSERFTLDKPVITLTGVVIGGVTGDVTLVQKVDTLFVELFNRRIVVHPNGDLTFELLDGPSRLTLQKDLTTGLVGYHTTRALPRVNNREQVFISIGLDIALGKDGGKPGQS